MTDEVKQTTQWRLFLPDDSGTGQIFPIAAETFTIGREADNTLSLDDSQISGHHARLNLQGDHLIIEDLRTTNGTVVNGEAIKRPHVLQDGDVISLGNRRLVVQNVVTKIEPAPQPAPAPPKQRNDLVPWLIAAIVVVALSIIGLLVLGAGLLYSARSSSVPTTDPAALAMPDSQAPTIVMNQAPAANSSIQPGQTVTLQATASDMAGITRLELWANDAKVDEVSNQLEQSTPSMTAGFEWMADTPGSYALQIRAYNQNGAVSIQPVAMVTVAGDAATAPQTPSTLASAPTKPPVIPSTSPTTAVTPSPTTLTVTSTTAITSSPTTSAAASTPAVTSAPGTVSPAPTAASLVLKVPVMVVRTGPSTLYDSLGRLESNDQPEIIGQADVGQGNWWQIRYDPAPNNVGWVPADPDLGIALNPFNVPQVTPPPLPTSIPADTPIPTRTPIPTLTPIPSATPIPPTNTPSPTPTDTPPPPTVIRPPDGQTLLIVGNRSFINQSARLTLSGGKSVGGGLEIDPPPGGEVQVVLEPDFYRALWSAPYNSFTRGSDFTAVAGKVMVMWIVPEEGRTDTEVYDQLVINPTATPTALPTSTTVPPPGDKYVAPPGKGLLVVGNRSSANEFGVVTITGGSFGGGQQFILNANTETVLEAVPGTYRTVWSSPVNGGVNAGRDFVVTAGEVIFGWIIPEDRTVFMQFPGQPVIQINN
ncbi:MAG: FHA domain-containing protein [Anaerolineae bacterium]|nr:FHA domain-containing protein [Anaerolineae bacterium]